MYVVKNALKCISRAKGRNILIGIIVLVIAISACIGLSIRQAASDAKQDALDDLSVTATISFDRGGQMSGFQTPPDMGSDGERGEFDKSQFSQMMGQSSSLTLDEYQKYASHESVDDFYYSYTVSINGSDDFSPVSNSTTDSDEETDTEETETEGTDTDETDTDESGSGSGSGFDFNFGSGFGGGKLNFQINLSDFQIVGYSNKTAMVDFAPGGTSSVTEGTVFDESTENFDCIISSELATYNSLNVGDSVTVCNPQNEEETYTLNIVGVYTNTAANNNEFANMMEMTLNDPANQIYMSYNALNKMVGLSETANSAETEDEGEDEGEEEEASTASGLRGSLSATYVFKTVENYEKFKTEVYSMGLDESYTVNSTDVSDYEESLKPLNSLNSMTGWFLIIILLIGAIILIVLNIFNVRERKYEIGVLTAMGMKKGKVAMQFLTEIFVVTLIAVIIGIGVGAVSSVPVADALLENQIASQEAEEKQFDQNFGIPQDVGNIPNMGGMGGPGGGGFNFSDTAKDFAKGTVEFISDINGAINLTVVWQMFGIAILLTLVSGAVSMLFIMRYEPLKILANRD